MSAPATNIERQKRRHGGVLSWMAAATGFVGVLFIIFYVMAVNEDTPATTSTPAATADGGR